MATSPLWWPKHKWSCFSLALSLLEILVSIATSFIWPALEYPRLYALAIAFITWLFVGSSAVVAAFHAVIVEPGKHAAVISLIVALLAFVICGYPFLWSDFML